MYDNNLVLYFLYVFFCMYFFWMDFFVCICLDGFFGWIFLDVCVCVFFFRLLPRALDKSRKKTLNPKKIHAKK